MDEIVIDPGRHPVFRLVGSDPVPVHTCFKAACLAKIHKLLRVDPRNDHVYSMREKIEMVATLPPYVIERYVLLLTLWRRRQHRIPSLVTLCSRLLEPGTISFMLPNQGRLIQRMLRQMFTDLDHAERYERAVLRCPMRPFAQYSNFEHSLLQAWMNRNECIALVRCPYHRLQSRLHFMDCLTYGDFEDSDVLPRSFMALGIDHTVRPHQCGYVRCTCISSLMLRPTPGPLSLTYNNPHLAKLNKVPKEKLQAERAARQANRKRR